MFLRYHEAKEFKDEGVADGETRLGLLSSGLDEFSEAVLVFGQARAFVVEAGDLTSEFADGPVAPDALDLVEAALGFVGELQQFGQVGKGEALDQLWSHCLHNWRFGSH